MEEDEYRKLPIEDRCVHKLWKARVNGYEEVTKLFRQIDDEKSPEFGKYLGLVKKFVTDSNAVGQEKGLEATLAYVENYAFAGKTVGEVMSGIVNKCMSAPKAKTRELAQQILLMYIEIEKQEAVQEELLKGMDLKNPKIVSACVNAATTGLREFGSKVITVKPLIKKIPSLLSDRDKGVRDEGKAMVVEIYKWIGAALRSQLTTLQPVQITELETEFTKVEGQKVSPTRYLRSQQQKQAKIMQDAEEGIDEEKEDEGEDTVQQVDAYDLADPVDILGKLPKDFFEKVEAKKWQERKEAMEVLENLVKSPKLENGEYGDLVRAIKKIIQKDSNVVVIAIAGKCLAGLAAGLKKRFQPYAGACIPALLEKFKEKKLAVVTSMREAIDSIFLTTNIEAIVEDALEALANKNPSVKLETASFLSRSFSKTQPTALNKKLLKSYTTALIKTLNEPDPGVRDASAEALGTLMKLVGEKAVAPFLVELDKEPLKVAKIKECCEKAVIQVKIAAPKKERPNTAPSKAPQKGGSTKPKPVTRPTTAGAAKKKPQILSGSATIVKSKSSSAIKKPAKVIEKDLTLEEVEEIANELFSADVISGLADTNWKIRLQSMERISEKISDTDINDVPVQVFVKIINRKPGLKDTNFQVLKLRLDGVRILAEKGIQSPGKFSTTTAESILNDVADKLGDAKNGTVAADLLTAIAEATALEYVATEVLNFAFTQKSPRVQQEALMWLSIAVREFGIGAVNAKFVIEHCRKALSAVNPTVRTCAVTLLGTLYMYMGPSLLTNFENEKPALKQQISTEFEKYENERPPPPVRGNLSRSDSREDLDDASEEYEDALSDPMNEKSSTPEKSDSAPRVDINGHITEAFINDLSDKNWKVRNETLTKLAGILNDAKYIKANIGQDLIQVLAQRLTDSNSKIAQSALAICQSMAEAMGSPCKQYVRTLFPGFLQGLGDSKGYIRTASITCVNTWGDLAGYKEFFEGEMIADALKVGSPTMRAELWAWLAEKLIEKVAVKSISKEELILCLPHLYSNLEDRNPDVRKNANEAVLGIMIHLGYECMAKNAEKLKPSSKPAVMAALDKARPNLPVKPLPKEKARAPSNDKARGGNSKPGSAKAGSAGKTKTGIAAPNAKASSRKKEDDVDTSPLFVVNNLKHQRVIDEQKLRVLKWNFTTPREEFVELLKDQMMTANVNKSLIANMFHADFRYHLKAIENLQEDLQVNSAALMANLDLVLKWLTLRFFDTNPSVILKGLEYLHTVFACLEDNKYRLLENEASSFVPYLVLKIGDPKDLVRNGVRSLFRQIVMIYPMHRIFSYVMEGIKSKNARQRTECLDVMGSMIENNGIHICVPSPAAILKEVAKQISDRDNSVRSAALNCIVQAHFAVGDQVFKMVGQISDKDMSLLEERIKRVKRNAPPRAAPVGDGANRQSVAAFPRANNVSPVTAQAPTVAAVPQTDDSLAGYQDQMDDEDEDDDPMDRDIPQPIPSASTSEVAEPTPGPFKLDPHFLEFDQDSIDVGKLYTGLKKFDLNFLKDQVKLPPRMDPNAPVLQLSPPAPIKSCSNSTFTRPSKLHNQQFLKPNPPRVGQELLLEKTINNIGSPDFGIVIPAIEHMQEILRSSKANLMTEFEDQFMIAITVQLKLLHSMEPAANKDILKVYRALFTVMDAFYSGKIVGKRVSATALKDIINQYIILLVEARLEKCENGETYVRVINLQCVKMIEKSDHTNILCALIRLLKACVHNMVPPDRLVELVMKCLWRAIKIIPEWKDEIDYESVLLEVHLFFKDFPSHWWKDKPDTAQRTMKTVVHSMAKCKGGELMMHLGKIPNTNDSELESYLLKIMKSLKLEEVKSVPVKKETMFSLTRNAHNTFEDIKSAPVKKERFSLTRNTHTMLTEIFQKIGAKEETREGLNLLYDFKQQHPEADIEPFLKKSSPFFQEYIENGLKDIEKSRQSSFEAKEDALNSSHQASTITIVSQNNQINTATLNAEMEAYLNHHRSNIDEIRKRHPEVDAMMFENNSYMSTTSLPMDDFIRHHEDKIVQLKQKLQSFSEQ